MLSMRNLFLLFLLGLPSLLFAQGYSISDYHCDSLFVALSNDDRVTDEFSQDELSRYYIEEPAHLIKIDIVQNHSFKVYTNNPTEVSGGRQLQFIESFDIRKYENRRKMDERTTLVYDKYGVSIELLSITELNQLIDQKKSESQNYVLTSFPNDSVQSTYTSKKDWALDHPQLAQILNL